MAKGVILGQTPNASNITYNNNQTSSIITGNNVQQAIDQLFTSVSNGKKKIAGAITDKGVSTSENASFDTMVNNIKTIQEKTFFNGLNVLNTSENSYLYDIMLSGSSSSTQWPVFSSNCPLSYTPFIAIGQIIQNTSKISDNTISMYKVENKSVQKIIDFNIVNNVTHNLMDISFDVDRNNLVGTVNNYSQEPFQQRYIFVPDLSKSVNHKTKATYVASKNQQDTFDFKFEISNFSPAKTDFIRINKVNKWEAIGLYDKKQLFTYRNVYVNNLIMKNGAIKQVTTDAGAGYPFVGSDGDIWDSDKKHGFYLDDNGFHLLIRNSSYGKNYGVKFNIDLDIEIYNRPRI